MLAVLLGGACGDCRSQSALPEGAAEPAPEKTVTLRFRPQDRLDYREHWIYDLEVPGTGLLRNALSLDVLLMAKLESESFAVRKTIVRQQLVRDRVVIDGPSLAGASLVFHHRRDGGLASEIRADAKDPVHAALARSVAEAARFGTLIEYPDQELSVGDSWSIEPRTLSIAPGVQATLRPSYTLESLTRVGMQTVASIASDIQVDLVPVRVSEGVTIEGGGTASGTLRVRVHDGALLDAKMVMHFSQEITLPGSETLGYREFSATARVFTTDKDKQPNLTDEPYTLEPGEDDKECALLLSSAAQRFSSAPVHQRNYLVSALHAVTLPNVRGGHELRDVGTTLTVSSDARKVELDGTPIDTKELPRALRNLSRDPDAVVYVYADAALSFERLRALLSLLSPRAEKRLMLRDAEAALPPAKATRYQEERLRFALAAPDRATREARLHELLAAHLMLCEPAFAAFTRAMTDQAALPDLRGEIVRAFVKCGCTTTNLDGLETTLYAIFGSPDLRYVALPPLLDELEISETATVTDVAKLLWASRKSRSKSP